jgi:hypothetical protein
MIVSFLAGPLSFVLRKRGTAADAKMNSALTRFTVKLGPSGRTKAITISLH